MNGENTALARQAGGNEGTHNILFVKPNKTGRADGRPFLCDESCLPFGYPRGRRAAARAAAFGASPLSLCSVVCVCVVCEREEPDRARTPSPFVLSLLHQEEELHARRFSAVQHSPFLGRARRQRSASVGIFIRGCLPSAPCRYRRAEVSTLGDLPDFRGPSRLLKDAYKKSQLVQPNTKLGNQKKRATKFATQKIDAYASGLSMALRDQLKAFRGVMTHLPPFQEQLAELTLAAREREGGKSLKDVEAAFDSLRRSVVRAGKEAAQAAKAASASEAKELQAAGLQSVEEARGGERRAA